MKTLFKLFTILFLGVKFADCELFTNQKEILKKIATGLYLDFSWLKYVFSDSIPLKVTYCSDF